MKEQKGQKRGIKVKVPKVNPWAISTLILLIILAIFLVVGPGTTGKVTEVDGKITAQEAADKTIDYINKNLIRTGKVSFVSVEEVSGMYEVTTSYEGQEIPVHVTIDGVYMYLPSGTVNLDETLETPEQQPQEAFDAPDKEKPEVDLYVMSFCPYGKIAESAMEPVIGLLGDKADIKIRFIANVQGNNVESVQSLHGIEEAKEDLRQICVMKDYDQETFWNYVMEINENCFSIYRDSEKMDACWKEAAEKFDIKVDEIEACAYGSEGLNLLKVDEELTDEYGVSGSPTLIINGQRYSGARTSEAFKQGICSGFETEPSECSETLEGSTAASASPAGAC